MFTTTCIIKKLTVAICIIVMVTKPAKFKLD